MGGAQPLAATMNGGVALVIEVDPQRIAAPPRDAVPRRSDVRSLDEALDADRGGAAVAARARSIALEGNAADVLPELVRRGIVPDVVTDQTSAHDALNGYVPNGLTLADADALRARRSGGVQSPRDRRDGRATSRAMLRAAGARRGRVRLRQQHPRAGGQGRRRRRVRHSRASCPSTSGRCSARARGRSAGPRSRAIRRHRGHRSRSRSRCSPTTRRSCRWIRLARERVAFQGLPARICWLGYGERARFGLAINDLVRRGVVKAPIVIGRDHLDTGSVASPNRETEGMRDGSDAIADWPVLNALLNTSAGATWVSVHHGGGVGIGYSLHAGMVIVADGTREADEKLQRVLTCDPGIGVVRHADAGYPEAIATAHERGIDMPMLPDEGRGRTGPS